MPRFGSRDHYVDSENFSCCGARAVRVDRLRARRQPTIEQRLQQLEAEQAAMKQQLAERDAAIQELKRELAAQGATTAPVATTTPVVPRATEGSAAPPQTVAAGQAQEAAASPETRSPTPRPVETWGVYDPGDGFLVGRSEFGELSISSYAMARYMSQHDDDQVFTDHLGNERPVDIRNDIFSHRIMAFLKGWMGSEKLDLQHHDLDGQHDRPGRDLRESRLPVQQEIQPVRRPDRQPGVAFAERFAPVLAGSRSRHGRRVLPAIFRLGHLRHRRSVARPLVQRRRIEQQQRARREGEPARPQVQLRRHGLVDADDARVRPTRCVRRLGMARGHRDSLRSFRTSRARNRASARRPAAVPRTPRCASPTA